MKNVGEKEAWAYPGTTQIFWVPPIISGTEKDTDFIFGQYIQRFRPNKIPLKILEKREHGHIQGLPNFFGYPLLCHEREKLRISNCASTFKRSIRTKVHKKILRKGRVSVSRDCPFFRYPRLSLRNSNFARAFMGSIGSKAH